MTSLQKHTSKESCLFHFLILSIFVTLFILGKAFSDLFFGLFFFISLFISFVVLIIVKFININIIKIAQFVYCTHVFAFSGVCLGSYIAQKHFYLQSFHIYWFINMILK